jgi:hypothetical protein
MRHGLDGLLTAELLVKAGQGGVYRLIRAGHEAHDAQPIPAFFFQQQNGPQQGRKTESWCPFRKKFALQ